MASRPATLRPALSTSLRRAGPLANVNVLIVDADTKLAHLLRQVLSSLGFGAIYMAQDGEEACAVLARVPIDLTITDWEMERLDGIGLLQCVRSGEAGCDRRLPVLMLTGRAKRRHVEQARDAGVTEFLVKPFSVRTLCDRLLLIIEHPRSFILSDVYAGPCRRRQQALPPGKADQRLGEAAGQQIVAQNEKVTILRRGKQEVAVIAPDFAIKEKVAAPAFTAVFGAESVQRAQRMIVHSRGEFLNWVVEDLKTLSKALSAIEIKPDHGRPEIARLEQAALRIKSQAGMFDYDLATQIADSLLDLCANDFRFKRRKTTAVRKHIEALYVVFERYIQGNGGAMGEELLASLAKLADTTD